MDNASSKLYPLGGASSSQTGIGCRGERRRRVSAASPDKTVVEALGLWREAVEQGGEGRLRSAQALLRDLVAARPGFGDGWLALHYLCPDDRDVFEGLMENLEDVGASDHPLRGSIYSFYYPSWGLYLRMQTPEQIRLAAAADALERSSYERANELLSIFPSGEDERAVHAIIQASLEMRLGNLDRAEEILQLPCTNQLTAAEARRLLGFTLQAQRLHLESAEYFQDAANRADTAEFRLLCLYQAAKGLLEGGREDEANDIFLSIAEIDPDYADVQGRIQAMNPGQERWRDIVSQLRGEGLWRASA